MAKRDYYDVLGISKHASDDDIRKAYRTLARKYHPDVCKEPDAKEKFTEISEAYETLHDKDKRAAYDSGGFDAVNMSGGFGGFDPFEMFRHHFGGFGGMHGMFDGAFGGHSHEPPDMNAPETGHDICISLTLNLKDALCGCTKTVTVNMFDACPRCGGNGIEKGTTVEKCPKCGGRGMTSKVERNGFMTVQTMSPCQACHGVGSKFTPCSTCNGAKRMRKVHDIDVKIPQGMSNGQKLRIRGRGESGLNGGSAGDLYVIVNVEKNDLFEVIGKDIKTLVPVDPVTATLGGKMHITTPWRDDYEIALLPQTASGSTMTIDGHGVHCRDGTKGNLIVKFAVQPLKSLSEEQKALLESLRSTLTDSNMCSKDRYARLASRWKS